MRKNYVSLFTILSVLFLGMIISCSEPTNPKTHNEITEGTLATIESTSLGIKLSWKEIELPENTERILIETWAEGLIYLDLFEINDMTIKEVVDEYVEKDKRYDYRISCFDGTGQELARYYTNTVAKGGKGELKVNAEATADGIRLIANKNSNTPSYWLFRKATDTPEDDWETYDRFELSNQTDLSFTDKLVNSNKEYRYYVHEKIGNRTQIYGNGNKTIGDPIVKWPRFEIKTIKATGGSGEFKITKQPVITFDEDNNTLSITQLPEFTLNPQYELYFYFKNLENKSFYAGNYDSRYSNRTSWTLTDAIPGEWQFDRCNAYFTFDDFRYEYYFHAEDLPDIPTITVSKSTQQDDPPGPTPTPVDFSVTKHDDGILLEWGEMPEGVTKVNLRVEHTNSQTTITITDLTKTSFVDKYVIPGTTYTCSITAQDDEWNFIPLYNDTISITPENGLGEAKITNKPAATRSSENPNFVTFTTKPQVSVFSDLNFDCTFYYKQQGTDNGLLYYTVRSDNSGIRINSDPETGTWTLDNYRIDFDTESYDFKQWNYNDLSNLTDIPQTITLSE